MNNKVLQEINLLCNLVFNQNCTRLSFLLPDFLKKYRFDGDRYSMREIYLLIRQKILTMPSYENIKLDNINIKKMKKVPREFEKIIKIYNNNEFFDYIIHGSYADNTYTKASDIDDLVIIKKEAFENYYNFKRVYKILKKTNLLYQNVDPVQHHGHWLVTEFDLLDYDNSIIPIFVLAKNSVSLGRNVSINYNLVENSKGFKDIFCIILDELELESKKLFINKINIFSLKNLLSAVTLLFPLYYQTKGLNLDKKEAIKKAKEEFSKEELKLLEWSTDLRKNWISVKGYRIYFLVRMLNFIFRNRNLTVFLSKYFLPKIKISELPSVEKVYFEKFIYHMKFL